MVTATEKAPKAGGEDAHPSSGTRRATTSPQYKKNTIFRRIERRMSILEVDDPDIYVRFLQEHPEEVQVLFQGAPYQRHLLLQGPRRLSRPCKRRCSPRYSRGKPEDYTIRVWVPGCATGEEAYSIAIVIREYIDRHNLTCKFQIFGTDIDEDAITTARARHLPGGI